MSGRVQGVFYRATTQEYAKRLGLCGWVRNLEDGRVECLACGSEGDLQQLESWLGRGPENALVEKVEVTLVDDDPSLQ